MNTPTRAPCDPCSGLLHDIECGHRVKTRYYEYCGINCTRPGVEAPFICPLCVATYVRLQMELEGLSLTSSAFSVHAEREARIDAIVQKELDDLIMRDYRPTIAVPKREPVVQFFAEIEGFQDEPEKEESNRKYKRPGKGVRCPSSTSGFRVGKPRRQGRARARPLTHQTLQLGGRTRMVEGQQQIIPHHALRNANHWNPGLLVRSDSSDVLIGDTPMRELEPGVSTKVGGQYTKPRPPVASSTQFRGQPTRTPAPNVPSSVLDNVAEHRNEDDAGGAVRQAIDRLTLDNKDA